MPANALLPVLALGEATVPLASFVRPAYRHYFSGQPERPNYRMRRYDFPGIPAFMPMVRAFLDTCAAAKPTDYRYLFTLLGSELANNAIRHTLSGQPGGNYSLLVHHHREGMHLACRDRGGLTTKDAHLAPRSDGLNLSAESGRGLAMVNAFATEWGDNGNAEFRTVWLYLAYDLTGSRWNTNTVTAINN